MQTVTSIPTHLYTGPTYSDGMFSHCRILRNSDGELEVYTILDAAGAAWVSPARSAVNTLMTDMVPAWRAWRACTRPVPKAHHHAA